MSNNPTSALTLDVQDDGIAWLTLDVPGESQNTLKETFAGEFEDILDTLATTEGVRALVVRSGKPGSFLAGADIEMLRAQKAPEDVRRLSQRGQEGFQRLESLPFPVICAIDGPCLGGGLELALACSWRIATESPSTKLGLPEVMLGLLPGAGGTQRLPRTIGIAAALDLMLTGKELRPAKARKVGLVDEVVAAANLEKAARAAALRFASKGVSRKRTTDAQTLLLEENPLGRKILFQQARARLHEKTRGNYPAPERIIDAVELGYAYGIQEGYQYESRFFAELAFTPEARQFMGIYFARNALRKDNGVSNRRIRPRPIQQVGVLGAGLMGAGIAWTTVERADIDVRLKDRDAEGLGRGMKTIHGLFQRRVRRKAMSAREAERQTARITTTTDYSGFSRCDLIVEAVFEDLDIKHQVLRDIEAVTGEDTIFGTNTSSIPIHRIAEASSRPQNVIGLHYFSPVEKMPLLEIVVTDQTAPKVIATCVQFGKDQGKTVIVVRDGAGFYTSRILSPYLNEAARILSEGVAIERIDNALMDFGYPVGPLALLDEVGLDVGEKVGGIMIEAFGDRMSPPEAMRALATEGRKGRKNGKGFYTYGKGKKQPDASIYMALGVDGKATLDDETIALRCALLMVNEAVMCLEEDVLRSARDGDIGAIFGLGFPPFRGGPFRYVDSRGASAVVEDLQRLADTYGPRFTPAQLLVDMAASGKTFHDDA